MADRLIVTARNDEVLAGIDRLEKQMRHAATRAVNTTAFAARNAGRALIASAIDRPMTKTINLPQVTKRAIEKLQPTATVALDYRRFSGTEGYLTPQIEGGSRVTKAHERRLQAAGLMPRGMYAVYAKRSGALDRYGNLPGAKIRQILSWFQTFKEAGHTNNMLPRTMQQFRLGKRKGLKFGFAYFISTGQRFGSLGMRLPRGVWERHYPNGTAGKSFIRPVLLFVPSVRYSARLDYVGTIERTVEATLEREFDRELARALRTAR